MKRLLILLLTGAAFAAPVTVKTEDVAGHPAYRLVNYRVNLLVDPTRGGAVVSYRDKLGNDAEIVNQRPRNGLCMDHFQAQPWPGELLDATYAAEILEQTDQQVRLKLTHTAKGSWRGADYPQLAGIVLEKVYTLRADSPALVATVTLTAPGNRSALVAYWMQHVTFAGGDYDAADDWGFRPSVRGVRAKSRDSLGHMGREDFLKDFNDGWIALIDRPKKVGIVSITDYDQLRYLYLLGGNITTEPMFNVTWLPPGGSVTHEVTVVPLAGLDNVVTANRDFVAGYSLNSDHQGAGKVELSVVRSVAPPQAVELAVQVQSIAADTPAAAGTVTFPAPGDTAAGKTLSFTGAGDDPLLLRVQAKAGDNSYAFEDFWAGSYKWGENIDTDLQTPVYKAERVPQKLTVQKPERIALRKPQQDNVWFVEGLMDDAYGIARMVRLTGGFRDDDMRDIAYTQFNGSFGMTLTDFPYDYERLLSYNVLVVGGVRNDALDRLRTEMIADFLDAGGGMIVLGGPAAYRAGRWQGTRFAEFLPVALADGGPGWVDLGVAGVLAPAMASPILSAIDFAVRPAARFAHPVDVKPEARVLVTAGGRPFIVLGEYGKNKGRVACILAPPTGVVGEDNVPFWEWPDWPYLMRQVNLWVLRREDRLVQ